VGTILPGLYQLHDHGEGNVGPDYGLRLDALGTLFSMDLGSADVTLDWDGGATATITGQMYRVYFGEIWDIDFTLTGVTAVGTLGFTATGGAGTVTDPSNNVTAITGMQNGDGDAFVFLADGDRLTGDDDTPVGRGWIVPPDSTNDWLVRAELIPEPASVALLTAGGLLTLARRR
jgi:hypothetical protein